MSDKILIGAREWCSLPELGIDLIRAKVDSGAKTTALHADNLEKFTKNNENWVRFTLKPFKKLKPDHIITCEAKLQDKKKVIKSSNGNKEERYVIETPIILGNQTYPIEITLTNRNLMGFNMLLGREAMIGRNIIDCEFRYILGKPKK
jgi:ribosomal protein S6--L-glutamate ligase